MVFPLVGALALGAIARATPSALHIGSKVSKFYGKYGSTSLGQATQFGIGYGASTNIGYNLSDRYVTSGFQRTNSYNNPQRFQLGTVPYGQYRSYGSRYSRYRPRYSRYRRRRPMYRRQRYY